MTCPASSEFFHTDREKEDGLTIRCRLCHNGTDRRRHRGRKAAAA